MLQDPTNPVNTLPADPSVLGFENPAIPGFIYVSTVKPAMIEFGIKATNAQGLIGGIKIDI